METGNRQKTRWFGYDSRAVRQWTVPKSTGQDYFDQMTAEVREKREDNRGRIRHLWVQKRRDNQCLDCELLIHGAAIITGLVRVAVAEHPSHEGEHTPPDCDNEVSPFCPRTANSPKQIQWYCALLNRCTLSLRTPSGEGYQRGSNPYRWFQRSKAQNSFCSYHQGRPRHFRNLTTASQELYSFSHESNASTLGPHLKRPNTIRNRERKLYLRCTPGWRVRKSSEFIHWPSYRLSISHRK